MKLTETNMKHFCAYLLCLCSIGMNAQWLSENFENYAVGDYISLVGQPSGVWTTWTPGNAGTSMDAQISNEAALSGSNSLKIYGGISGGPMDIVLLTGLEGTYEVTFSIFVPAGNSGYYNFQENLNPGIDWAFDCYLSGNGGIEFNNYGGGDLYATYALNQWLTITHLVDTANDLMSIYLDGEFIGQLPYDGAEIGGINFYALGDGVNLPIYYIDDITIELSDSIYPPGCTDITACNFVPTADIDDGSCLYYDVIGVCGGTCLEDLNQNGVCDVNEGEDGLLCEESVPTSAPMHPFISEYVDHWFLTNAIELFNPTSNSIDLSDYSLQMYADGNPFITDELQLNGLLEPFDTWVIVNGSTEVVGCIEEWDGEITCTYEVFPELQDYADQFGIGVPPSPLFFDGDDALVLLHEPTMTQVDIFGKIGQDPGEGWTDNAETGYVGTGSVITAINTLRRKPNVSQGVQNNPDEFNALDEWSVEGNGAFSGLGHHEYCFVSNIFGCTSSGACNYNFDATDSDGSCYFPGDPCDDGDATTSNDMYNDSCQCEGESAIVGCINPNACNYNADATESDGSCLFPGDPCDDGDASTTNDMYTDSCECEGESAIIGCVNPNACNYNPDAVESDGSCYFPGDPCDDGDATTSNDMYNDSCECEGESAITGCINPNACNYNADATESDGSCLFPGDPCDDGDESTTNDMYTDSCECQGDEPSQVSEDVLELALFPNPVHDWLSVRLEDGLAASLILFDPMGRVVQTWSTIGSARLDLSHLPPGPYVMSIHPHLGPARSERISILTWD